MLPRRALPRGTAATTPWLRRLMPKRAVLNAFKKLLDSEPLPGVFSESKLNVFKSDS